MEQMFDIAAHHMNMLYSLSLQQKDRSIYLSFVFLCLIDLMNPKFHQNALSDSKSFSERKERNERFKISRNSRCYHSDFEGLNTS
jgi:hypothetical protein